MYIHSYAINQMQADVMGDFHSFDFIVKIIKNNYILNSDYSNIMQYS